MCAMPWAAAEAVEWCRLTILAYASAAAAASGPAITSEERVEERMAFKMLFYQVGRGGAWGGNTAPCV
jgi:hypothetical protein